MNLDDTSVTMSLISLDSAVSATPYSHCLVKKRLTVSQKLCLHMRVFMEGGNFLNVAKSSVAGQNKSRLILIGKIL